MFHIPHRPEPVIICAFTVKQRLSPNLNARLSKRIWAALCASSCLRARFHRAGENNECATVLLGGFHLLAPPPPPPPPWLHTYVTYLTGTFAHARYFCLSSPGSLALSARITCARDRLYFCLLAAGLAGWLRRREDSAPSPSRIQPYLCALSVPLGLPMRKTLPCLIPVQLSSPRLILPVRGSLRAATVHDHLYCTAYAQTRTRLVWRRAHHAFSRRLLCEHPLPFLPPLFPPSHPAAAGRPDSHRIPRILLAWRQSCIPRNGRWLNLKSSGHNLITMAAKRAERTLSQCVKIIETLTIFSKKKKQ